MFKKLGRLQKTGRQTLKKLRLFLVFGGGIALSGVLLAYFVWFTLFYLPEFSRMHPQPPAPMQMFMSGKVNVLLNNGTPAANAVVTLDGGQQVMADSQGQVAFEHLMLHDHWLSVFYNNQHYEQLLHVHTLETTVGLAISLETHQTISWLLGTIWLVWTLFLLVVALKYFSINPLVKLNRLVAVGRTCLALLRGRPTFRFGQLTGFIVSCMVAVILINPFQDSLIPAKAAVLASLPTPKALSVEQDDNNVLLSWNGGVLYPDQSEPAGVGGYRVSWGLAGQALSNTILTTYRMVQIQPLVNGQSYQAQVQSVDMLGNLSNPSQIISFTGDPSRVNALRARMTGFFDDFNRSAGAFDELKWNQAVSRCNNEALSASFINAQFHAHDFVSAGRCDRSQVVDRARATFDYTNRTGTIAFDLDGGERRDFFYLDLMPAALDVTGHTDLDVGNVAGYPANMLRFKQNGNQVDIIYTAPNGNVQYLASTDWNPYPPLDWVGVARVPNVRRHWEIKLSKSLAQVYINGKLVLQASLNLAFTRATVHWNHFSYNTGKANEPYSLLHWDNFGFDGPAPTTETHNYRTDGYLGREFMPSSNYSGASTSINIPDAISTATARRFMFTLQTDTDTAYQWSASDTVRINGQAFSIPKPTDVAANSSFLVDAIHGYSETIAVPAGVFKTGANSVVFTCLSCGVLNIHAEFDFPKGSAPAFTSPSAIYPATLSPPVIPDVGPGVTLDAFGSTAVNYGDAAHSLTGVVPIHFTVHNEIALNGMGIAIGLNKVQLRVDQQVVYEQLLNSAPYSELTYNLDTARLTNGTHQMDIVAWNNNGSISIPDYFLIDARAGDYFPIAITTSNRTVPAPTNLTATASGSSQINLSWADNAGTETGYRVERQQGPGGAFAVIATLAANATGYQDTANLKGGLLYGYRVIGFNTYGSSSYSNVATAVLPIAAPTGLAITPVSLIQINLSWTDTTGGIAGFQVERSTGTGGGVYSIVGQVGPGTTTFQDIGLTPGGTYTYRVKGVTPYVSSAYSNTDTETTPTTATYTVGNLVDLLTALGTAQSGNTILLSGVANNTITLTSMLTIPQGVVVVGSCGADGPAITISGGSPLSMIPNAFSLSGSNILYGLFLENFANVPIKYTGRGNTLRCVSINRT